MQDEVIQLNKEVKDSINRNQEESGLEPSIFKKDGELAPSDAPMQMEGNPSIAKSGLKEKVEIVEKVEDLKEIKKKGHEVMSFHLKEPQEDGTLKIVKTIKAELRRLTVSEREQVAFYILSLYEELGLIDKSGKEPEIKMDRFDIYNYKNIVVISKYVRDYIAPILTGYKSEVFHFVQMVELMQLFNWLMENEIGLNQNIIDFLGIASQAEKVK